ncbi:hypothetical protein BOTBODRAFT_433000 [Botryobasidium botryosum FD-172 SS1]|uniref:Uncharacterized protein n=1 Tax=Botryobasidium botryosum (strain FD-172 SS1) TaxID=930990 RepID=A0A067MU07_BOTB1|nr:hypothetical protein BOTBODRAFT_433000 [Botryobasidium botryosum FD-172 SS1]
MRQEVCFCHLFKGVYAEIICTLPLKMSAAAPPTIYRLPRELLLEIFLEIYGPTIGARLDWKVKQKVTLDLSQVCRLWRDLIHGSSEFWAFIRLNVQRPNEDVRAADWIEHTAGRLLCIRVDCQGLFDSFSAKEGEGLFSKVASVLRQCMDRWVWFSIAVHPSFTRILFHHCAGEVPMLKALLIQHLAPPVGIHTDSESPLAMVPSGSPFYTIFSEPNHLPTFAPSFGSAITHLSVTASPPQEADSLLHALRLCPNLIELNLSRQNMRAPQVAAPVSLPHLTQLYAEAAQDLLPFLELPSLQLLSLPKLAWSNSVVDSLIKIIHHCPGLAHIGLDRGWGCPDWMLAGTTHSPHAMPHQISDRWRVANRLQDIGPKMVHIKLEYRPPMGLTHSAPLFRQLVDVLQENVRHCEWLSISALPELMDTFFQYFTTTSSLTQSVRLPYLVHLHLHSTVHYTLPFLELPSLVSLHIPLLTWTPAMLDSLLSLFRNAPLLSNIMLADSYIMGDAHFVSALPSVDEPLIALPSVTEFSSRGDLFFSQHQYSVSTLFLDRMALPQAKSLYLCTFPLDTTLRLVSTSISQLQHLSLSNIGWIIHRSTTPLLLPALVSLKAADQANVEILLTYFRCPDLQRLVLYVCDIKTANSTVAPTPLYDVLVSMAPPLARLDLQQVHIMDNDLIETLRGLPALKALRLALCSAADATLHALAAPSEEGHWITPCLEQIELWKNPNITPDAVLVLLESRNKESKSPNSAPGAGLPSVEGFVQFANPITTIHKRAVRSPGGFGTGFPSAKLRAALHTYGRFTWDLEGAGNSEVFATFGSAGLKFSAI